MVCAYEVVTSIRKSSVFTGICFFFWNFILQTQKLLQILQVGVGPITLFLIRELFMKLSRGWIFYIFFFFVALCKTREITVFNVCSDVFCNSAFLCLYSFNSTKNTEEVNESVYFEVIVVATSKKKCLLHIVGSDRSAKIPLPRKI